MKTLAELTTAEFIVDYLKGSIRSIQIFHQTGTAHGELDPSVIQIEDTFEFLEGTLSTRYAAPELTLGFAIVEGYEIPAAVKLWKEESEAIRIIEQWIPEVAEEYTEKALYKFIGTPISEQQSDIWSLAICYLFLYDELCKDGHKDQEQFLELVTPMLRLRGRSYPVLPALPIESDESAIPVATVVPVMTVVPVETARRRWTLVAPIHRGERNKTRRNPHS